GSGLMAYDSAKDWEWGDWWQQSKDSVSEAWRKWMWTENHSRLPDAPFGSEVPMVAPGSSAPVEVPSARMEQQEVNNYYGLEVPSAPDWQGSYMGAVEYPAYDPAITVDAPEVP